MSGTCSGCRNAKLSNGAIAWGPAAAPLPSSAFTVAREVDR